MDVTDKIIGVVIAFAVVAIAIPIAFGFLADGNFTLTVGSDTFDTAPLFILLGIIVVLGIVVLVYRNMKGK
jgi:hypothetical protein